MHVDGMPVLARKLSRHSISAGPVAACPEGTYTKACGIGICMPRK